MEKANQSANSTLAEMCAYIAHSGEARLPEDVIARAKHHILDTLAAIVSGSFLKPGLLAGRFARAQSGVGETQVIGSPTLTSSINAAFAHGMMAHADETDDSHPGSRGHPGCALVPAALSVAEREGADGLSFLRGVVAGYDIGCRITQALGVQSLRGRGHSTHAFGNNFGAAAAAASILRLKENLVPYVVSYAAQQASGLIYWVRDDEHVEKAFVFGGMPARNGVTAAILVQSGFTGVQDAFSGDHNFLQTFSTDPKPRVLTSGLGSRYEIMFTNIKKFCVGSPIQAAVDALLCLMVRHGFGVDEVERMVVRLPADAARTVDNRSMPDINVQYILSVTLLDRGLSFEAAHSFDRMQDSRVREIIERIILVKDQELSTADDKRQGIVEVVTKDGTRLREHVVNVRGTVENPMSREEVETKCSELMRPVLGADRTRGLIEKIWHLEDIGDVRELRPFLYQP